MALKFNPFTGTLDYVESGATKEKAEGVPAGGETSAVLTKHSATNYDDEWAKVKNANVAAAAGIEESKLSIPEMVKLTGEQTITGHKIFTAAQRFGEIEPERITMRSPGVIAAAQTMSLAKGVFAIEEEEKVLFGPEVSSKLKQVTLSGEVVANSTAFSTAPDFTYGVIPEASAVLESAVAGNKHRVMLLVNISTTETLTIVHEAAGAQKGLASNRFHFASGENVKLEPGEAIWLWYTEGEASGAKERWRDLGAWSINLPRPSAGTGLERAAGNVFAVKALGITAALLAAEAVEEAKIKNEAVTAAKIANEAITTAKLAGLAVTGPKLASESVTSGKIALEAVTAERLGKEAVTEEKLGKEAVTEEKIKSEAVTGSRIKAHTILAEKIFKETLTAETLGPESVTEAKIKALAVTEGKLAAEAVTNGKVKKESLEPNRLEKEKLTSEQIKPEGIKEASLEKEAVSFPKMAFFSFDSPIEIATGKTYEVPSNIQGLWKESISVQGTLNVQGRFDEVGVPEPLWYGETGVPTEVPSGKIYDIPAINSALWRDNMSVQGTINVQGRLTEV